VSRRNAVAIKLLGPDHRAAIEFLERLKASLEHTRRFTPPDKVTPMSRAMVQAEGDIEEFLILKGYWESTE
jgi:hypothetical protein